MFQNLGKKNQIPQKGGTEAESKEGHVGTANNLELMTGQSLLTICLLRRQEYQE